MGKKLVFILRLIIYIGLVYGVPIGLIWGNYGLWKDGGFTIAGIFTFLIIFLGGIKIGSMFKEALWWRWWVQLIVAITSSLWIIAIYFVADIISVNIDLVKKIALVSFFCVVVGRFFNPLPQWVSHIHHEERIKDVQEALKRDK